MSKVLVTGASGFVGRGAVAAFAADGYTVRAALRRPPPESFAAAVEVMQHPDLQQAFDWAPLLAGIDKVVHLAAQRPRNGAAAAALFEEVNHRATARLATAAALAGIRHFVYVSSIRAQSWPAADHAVDESDAPAPSDAYGRSKLAAENAVRDSGVPFTILRPAPLYGPSVRGSIGLFLRAVRSPWPLPLKDFVSRRSLLGLDNFLSALRFVLAARAAGETYVVADPGMPPRAADLAATLRRSKGRWPLVLALPTGYLELPLRLLGRTDLWDNLGGSLRVNPGKLIAAGWRPLHDTRTGLVALVQAAPR
jgi:nucleoside-diphosphate-sugar epimerase